MIYVDNDGVLCDYLKCFANFVGCGAPNRKHYHVGEACGLKNGAEFNDLLHSFHLGGIQVYAPLMEEGVVEQFNRLHEKLGVCVITSRPVEEYPGMLVETKNWLKEQGFTETTVLFSNSKEKYVRDGIIIEDNPTNATKVLGEGGTAILVKREYNSGVEGAVYVDSFKEAVDWCLTHCDSDGKIKG